MPNLEDPEDWQGFEVPLYTPVPDAVFDVWMPRLSGAEFKVLCYICRRTFGFKKQADDISIKQMANGIKRRDGSVLDDGTGLSESTVSVAVKGLVERGLIFSQRNSSSERGDEATTYRLKIRSNDPVPGNRGGGYPEIGEGGTRKSETARTRKSGTQETDVTRNSKQETEEQEEDSNLTDAGKNEAPPYSPWIAGIIEDYSREFGEPNSTAMNISRALRQWQESDIGEKAFVELLRRSRDLTRQAQGAQGNSTISRKMAYFFSVVADQARIET